MTLALSAAVSASVVRNGYHDVQVTYSGGVAVIARGYAKLRPRVTAGQAQLVWGQFENMTQDSWDRQLARSSSWQIPTPVHPSNYRYAAATAKPR